MGDRISARALLDSIAVRPQGGAITLSPDYLRAVAQVEALPANRNGADKTWVLRLVETTLRARRSAKRLR